MVSRKRKCSAEDHWRGGGRWDADVSWASLASAGWTPRTWLLLVGKCSGQKGQTKALDVADERSVDATPCFLTKCWLIDLLDVQILWQWSHCHVISNSISSCSFRWRFQMARPWRVDGKLSQTLRTGVDGLWRVRDGNLNHDYKNKERTIVLDELMIDLLASIGPILSQSVDLLIFWLIWLFCRIA